LGFIVFHFFKVCFIARDSGQNCTNQLRYINSFHFVSRFYNKKIKFILFRFFRCCVEIFANDDDMKRDINKSALLRGSEVCRFLGLGMTAGYRYLRHLETHQILLPVRLPAIKTPRYRRDEVENLAKNKELVDVEEFKVN